jgi:hypothetical protein
MGRDNFLNKENLKLEEILILLKEERAEKLNNKLYNQLKDSNDRNTLRILRKARDKKEDLRLVAITLKLQI